MVRKLASMSARRHFDGELYTRRFSYRRKSHAQTAARKIRATRKWKVRVVKSGGLWHVFHRRRR